jgi:hypothetical protein
MRPLLVMAARGTASGGGGGYSAETTAWINGITALSGSVTTSEKNIADAIIVAIQGASYGSKIKYLLPFIGGNIAAHRMPLRDSLAVGAASSLGTAPFVDADCTTATGLSNSTEKDAYLDSLIKPSQVGTSDNGGLGWYERNIGLGSNVEPIGVYGLSASTPVSRFVLDLRTSFQRFRWGDVAGSQAGPATTATNGHYYGQRSSTTLRRIYLNGASLGSDGTATTTDVGIADQTIMVMGCKTGSGSLTPWKGRGACAYLTDGTMSDADVAAFHTLLGTYLIAPTGR